MIKGNNEINAKFSTNKLNSETSRIDFLIYLAWLLTKVKNNL